MRPTSGWLCRCHHLSKLYWQLVKNKEISFFFFWLTHGYHSPENGVRVFVCWRKVNTFAKTFSFTFFFGAPTIGTMSLVRNAIPSDLPRLSKSHIFSLLRLRHKRVTVSFAFSFYFPSIQIQLPLNVIAIANQILNCPFYWYFRFDWMNWEIILNKCIQWYLLRFNVIWLLNV